MISLAELCKYRMDEKAIDAIETILQSGGNVEIRRRKDGYAIFETSRKIKYSV